MKVGNIFLLICTSVGNNHLNLTEEKTPNMVLTGRLFSIKYLITISTYGHYDIAILLVVPNNNLMLLSHGLHEINTRHLL